MNTKNWQRNQILPLVLMSIMAITRFDHFGSAISLPDASLAVFFLAGMAVTGLWFFGLLLLEAGVIDYVAITQLGASDFCISPAYLFLVPAYGAMWLGGKYSTFFKALEWVDSAKVFALAATATSFAFLIANGSFYLLSGRFGELSIKQYLSQVANYFPPYFSSTFIYLVIALFCVKVWKSMQPTASAEC